MKTLTELKKEIDKIKGKLIHKANLLGYPPENFGRKEVRKLQDKYGKEMSDYSTFGNEAQEMRMEILDLEIWCENY